MDIILYDTGERRKLYPLTLTRSVAGIRMGILTIKERWEKLSGARIYILTETYLQSIYETAPEGNYIFIDACTIPVKEIAEAVLNLTLGESLRDETGLVAGCAFVTSLPEVGDLPGFFKPATYIKNVKKLEWPHQVFQWNAEMLQFDFELVTKGRIPAAIDKNLQLTNPSEVFIEEGATVSHSSLNTSAGPVYIGRNATVMEGCLIRGPFALCEGAVLKMGSKVYGATTIGPYCTAGGEIKNSILTAYSNKAHDGYLGDSVLGEWCNMGAGTSNSNVKNTGRVVKLWSHYLQQYMPVGNKAGVIMGDYSRTAINSSINTGTVIGVCSNVFGSGLTPKVIPDFAWGDGQIVYKFEKAIKDIANWKKMKNKALDESETRVLKHIFDHLKR